MVTKEKVKKMHFGGKDSKSHSRAVRAHGILGK